jgi:hypothetical protein
MTKKDKKEGGLNCMVKKWREKVELFKEFKNVYPDGILHHHGQRTKGFWFFCNG